jgi:hypothetical protein
MLARLWLFCGYQSEVEAEGENADVSQRGLSQDGWQRIHEGAPDAKADSGD